MAVISGYPRRPLVDSSVLIAAWTERRIEPSREDCISFLEGVENSDGVLLIAAPTISELLKGTPPLELPRRKSVVPVPFDRAAARILGREMPPEVLKKAREKSKAPLAYFKYDALIAACAKAFAADCIVSLDETHMPELAKHVGLPFRTPAMYRRPDQKKLPLRPPAPEPEP
jgi:predicted nucleic acid-binding protein